jgi:hypothetical protein
MKKQSMPEKNNRKISGQPLVWPQYWNNRINEEIQMRAEKINNLLVIYESNLLDEIHLPEKNLSKSTHCP